VGISSAEIKAKLEDLLVLLHQDTAQLVDDSDPAKAFLRPFEARSRPMQKKPCFKLHTW